MFSRLISHLRPFRMYLALTVLCALAGGLLAVGQAAALSRLIARVFLSGQGLAAVTGLFRLLLLLIGLRAFLAWTNETLLGRLAVQLKARLRQELFDSLLRLGPAYTRGEKAGELSAVLFDGVEALGVYVSQYLPQAALAALLPLAILIIVFPRDWLSGLVMLLTAPLIPLFMYLIGKGAEALTKRQWNTLRRLEVYFLDSLQGLTTLKLFGRSRERAESIAGASERFRRVTLQVLRVTFLSAFVLELISTLSTAIVAVELSLRLLHGGLPFETAFFLLLLAPEFYLPLRMLGIRFHAGMAGKAAAKRIFDLLEQARLTPPPVERVTDKKDSVGTLRIANICYTYPGETQPALQNLTLKIQPGQHVALAGLTGAGKSTLAALLLGFMPPSRGRIELDGLPLDSSCEQIAWVPQSPHLFHDTLAANLRLARPAASPAEMESALHAAGLAEFVRSLPAGLDTVIGESGARLSGGEAQRLALARAFLKDAPILLLDEPASHLDLLTETALAVSTRRLMQGRTVITIAHHLSTFQEADRIFVLESGCLMESGTHADLLARDGVYARLIHGTAQTAEVEALPEAPFSSRKEESGLLPGMPEPAGVFISGAAPSPRALFRLLGFLRGSWSWVFLSVLLGVLTVGSSVGLMGTAAWLISTAALVPAFGVLQVAIVGVRFFGITRGVFRYTERLASHEVTFRLLGCLRAWFYRQLEPLAPARLLERRSGDLLARIISDVDTLENFYVRTLAPPVTALLVTVGMSLFLGAYDPCLAWVYVSFMALLGLVLPAASWALSRRAGAEMVLRRASFQAVLVDGLRGLADLLAFGRGSDYSARLLAADREYGRQQARLASIGGIFSGLSLFGMHAGVLAVLVLSIPLVGSGQLAGPMLAALALAVQASFEAVLPLPAAAQALTSCSEAARRLFEVVDTRPEVVDGSSPLRLEEMAPFLKISGLQFTYPSSPWPALEGIDLSLEPGKRVAIVGPSGSGKSTLANLLLRFWDYSSGRIELGGLDLHDLAQADVRSFFGVVPQNPAFLDGTIRQNLLLARPEASESDVQQALQRACLDDFIAGQAKGLDTPLGEAGVRLSGGERQRLALARAYLKDSPILLLDEPFSSLDPSTSSKAFERLYAGLEDRSLLLITHRLSGLDRMDEIIVLDAGRIIQRGDHATLLAQTGLYRCMVEKNG